VLITGFLAALIACSPIGAREIGPEDDFCRIINDPASGNEIELRQGEYRGPCTIRRGGTADRPLVIRGQDILHRPRLVYEGESANVLDVRADHVVIQGLAFGGTRRNVDGIRIRASRDIAVRDCVFESMGGIAIVANQSNLQRLAVTGNTVSRSNATAMYFGCHDGHTCRVSDIVIEKNLIDGVEAAEKEVGYGIQVKLNSSAIIRDNVIKNTKGPGIMIYGAQDLSVESLIERNFISGSRTSSGIVIGGGPALARNNIAAGNTLAGIALHDYAQRGLLRNIKVGFNTLWDNGKAAIAAAPDKVAESSMVGNVGAASAPGSLFPPAQKGLADLDNLACDRSCFADPDRFDFSPARSSLLDHRALGTDIASWFPQDDFFAQHRGSPLKIGAVESPARRIGVPAVH
jgi:hypothetical protein